MIDRPSILMELAIYVGLGVVWVLPFKSIFLGIGQAEPEDENETLTGRPGPPRLQLVTRQTA